MGFRNILIPIFIFLTSIFSENLFCFTLNCPNDEWKAYILYVTSPKEIVLHDPSEESDTVGFVYYLDKILIVEDGWQKFGWRKIVYPKSGYINEKYLITPKEKIEHDKKYNLPNTDNDYSKWTWEIISCSNDFTFVKSLMDEASETSGLLRYDDKTIIIKQPFEYTSVWIKTVYPFQGYVKYFDAFGTGGYPYIALGLTYGAKHIPYEKNLKNYFNPIGAYLEYSSTNWILGFRFGYNYAESRLSTFYIKTDQVYLHIVFRFLKLFNNKLELNAILGGNYWFSSFENKKYGTGNTYFRLEKDSGPGYVLGGGMIYNLGKFYIEAQYSLFGSRQAEFGTPPTQGIFVNYSTLYPGSNHFEIIFGYRFIL